MTRNPDTLWQALATAKYTGLLITLGIMALFAILVSIGRQK
jgi:tetrahydromethanopterin S-methyltransferase subunit B